MKFKFSDDRKEIQYWDERTVSFNASISDKCGYCNGTNIQPLRYSYNWNDRHETLMYRCFNKSCLKHLWLTVDVYSDGKFYSSSWNEVRDEISIDKLGKEYKCEECQVLHKVYGASDEEIHKEITKGKFASRILECEKCGARKNEIFFYPPFKYAQSLLNRVRVSESSSAIVIFAVTAIEVYFSKVETFISSTTSISTREKWNFQNLESIKKFIKKHLKLSVPELIKLGQSENESDGHFEIQYGYTEEISVIFDWELLVRFVKFRHRLVHEAGYDENYRLIDIEKNDALSFLQNAKNFIRCVDKEFKKQGYPF